MWSLFTLPFDITATKKRVITNVVDNLNMVELFVSCWRLECWEMWPIDAAWRDPRTEKSTFVVGLVGACSDPDIMRWHPAAM